jgi:putative tricarboxylic transport membrane protein
LSVDHVFAAGLAIVALVTLFIILPAQVETVDFGRIHPETIPKYTLWIIFVCAILQLFISSDRIKIDWVACFRILVFIGGFIVAIWALNFWAFEYIVPGFALSLMLFMGERRWYWLVVGAGIIPLGVWYLAENVLTRPLP